MTHPNFPHLFSPFDFAGVQLKNRLVMAPMSTGLAGENGTVQPSHLAFYRERALGGFGLIVVEFTCVEAATGRSEKHQLALESRANLDGHKRLVDAVKGAGAKVFVQLQHGGRFADKRFVALPKGPSAVYSRKDATKLVSGEYTSDDINRLVDRFGTTARLAAEAGYDGIEVHGAHGYLVAQFISPLCNRRDDEWGGDAERRMAFPIAIAKAARAEIGQRPLVFRLSVDEFLPGGITIDDTEVNAKMLVAAGTSAFHASTGQGPASFERVMEPMSAPEGWRIPYSGRLRRAVQVPVIAVGQIRDPAMAEDALASGEADLIAMGRPTLADAQWANKVRDGRIDEIRPCTSCNWCISGATESVSCAENPRTGNELEAPVDADIGKGKHAIVIGAGPGGIASALMLAEHGFKTDLYERRASLGGGLIASAAPPGKDKFYWYLDYLLRRLERSNVKVHLNAPLDAVALAAINPNLVFVAAGTRQRPMDLEGVNGANVLDSYEVLMGQQDHGLTAGQSIIVYGGGETGCETAEYFAKLGISVMLVSRSSEADLARAAEFVYRKVLIERLAKNDQITVVPNTHIVRIDEQGAELMSRETQQIRYVAVDRIVMAQGRDPDYALVEDVLAAGIPCYTIGDSRRTGRIGNAVHDAHNAIRSIAAERVVPRELAC
jgi:2,4-dienoyl-CoA reductase-like NADH-dependent reductase (Old Yellow Enzyme family)/thioredoxin reductase